MAEVTGIMMETSLTYHSSNNLRKSNTRFKRRTIMADIVSNSDNGVVYTVQSSNPLIVFPVGYVTPRAISITVF